VRKEHLPNAIALNSIQFNTRASSARCWSRLRCTRSAPSRALTERPVVPRRDCGAAGAAPGQPPSTGRRMLEELVSALVTWNEIAL
jgi:hypothetical protein